MDSQLELMQGRSQIAYDSPYPGSRHWFGWVKARILKEEIFRSQGRMASSRVYPLLYIHVFLSLQLVGTPYIEGSKRREFQSHRIKISSQEPRAQLGDGLGMVERFLEGFGQLGYFIDSRLSWILADTELPRRATVVFQLSRNLGWRKELQLNQVGKQTIERRRGMLGKGGHLWVQLDRKGEKPLMIGGIGDLSLFDFQNQGRFSNFQLGV